MTTTVQMLKDRPNGNGGTYSRGSIVSVPDDLADYFRSTGAARLVSVESEQIGATAHLNSDGKRYDVQTRALTPVMATQSVTGGITKIWTGTQAQYDAIATKATDTLYIIVAG